MPSMTAMAALAPAERFATAGTNCWGALRKAAEGARAGGWLETTAGRGALRPAATAESNESVGRAPTPSRGGVAGIAAAAELSSLVGAAPGVTCRAAGAGFSKVTSK